MVGCDGEARGRDRDAGGAAARENEKKGEGGASTGAGKRIPVRMVPVKMAV